MTFEVYVCQNCRGQMEFPVAQSGQTVACKLCGQQTVIYKAPRLSRARRSRKKSRVPVILGVVSVVLALVVALGLKVFVGDWMGNELLVAAIGGVLLLGAIVFAVSIKS